MSTQEKKNFEQLRFNLPEIDRDLTRDRVEGALETCRLYMQIGYHPELEAKTTPAYSMSPASQTNAFHSNTESTAQKNVDEEQRRKEHVRRVKAAVDRLGPLEKKIITKRYLEDDDVVDYTVWPELNLSERKYYRVKARAFYKLALMLKIEVYVEDESA